MNELAQVNRNDLELCLCALSEVLGVCRETADKGELVRRLADYLVPEFDVGVLEPDVRVGDVKAWVIVGDILLIWFGTAENDYPFRATFSRIEQGQWRIVAFEFGCPACFGETVLDGNVCPICTGIGFQNTACV